MVVTPLIALMIDQKDKLSKRGIRVEFVGEAQDNDAAVLAVLKSLLNNLLWLVLVVTCAANFMPVLNVLA